LRQGALLFDTGGFFQAHEAWEAHWLMEQDPSTRLLFQGLIQIAAGFHKMGADRADSAARLLARGLAKLDGCPALVAERGLAAFVAEVREWARALTAAGPPAALDDTRTHARARIPRLGLKPIPPPGR
jgi:predicted metal-dependent hydrolase